MPHSAPDFRSRSRLTELMDEPCTREQLRGCLRDIARINRWTLASRPVLQWLDKFVDSTQALTEPLRILDVGSGYGDGLRRIEQWARARRVAVELTGLDLNRDATSIAADVTQPSSRIHWVCANVFHYVPPRPFHLVISSLFTHHLGDGEIVRFLCWMEQHAKLGWFINDLSRAPIPYYAIRAIAKLARLHPFVQYDAPLSIARSFVPADWQALCAAAGFQEKSVQILSYRPARLCVARHKHSRSPFK
jgi:SAM-dependent methyltransferase